MSPSYQIDMADEQERLAVDSDELREIARLTLLAEHVAAATISIALVDDATIHELNRAHLDHDYPTDVLSFLLECEPPAAADPSTPASHVLPLGAGKRIDGEVIVSTDTAAREAERFGWTPESELALYVVHGLLHLCGYDDHDDADRTAMRDRERAILRTWNLAPHYDD